MKISVVVVTYNTGQTWLDKCLGSLRLCSIDLSIILIDNASSDNTVEHVRKNYPEVDLICSSENLGFAKANNIGIDKAFKNGSDHVFLLNHDAWIVNDCIERLVEIQKKHPQFGIVSPIHLNGTGDLLDWNFNKYISSCFDDGRKLYSDSLQNIKFKPVYDINFVNAAAWLISRKCIEDVGLFDTELFLHYGEDSHYVQRAHFHGFRLGVVAQSFIHHDREERSGGQVKSVFNKHNEILNFILDTSNVLNDSENKLINYFLRNSLKCLVVCLLKFDIKGAKDYLDLYKLQKSKIRVIFDQKKKNRLKAKW